MQLAWERPLVNQEDQGSLTTLKAKFYFDRTNLVVVHQCSCCQPWMPKENSTVWRIMSYYIFVTPLLTTLSLRRSWEENRDQSTWVRPNKVMFGFNLVITGPQVLIHIGILTDVLMNPMKKAKTSHSIVFLQWHLKVPSIIQLQEQQK